MRQILHISDVHFGPPHWPQVTEGVERLVVERRPDLVVLSGDLTQRAKPRQFQAARRFVNRLEAPVLAVPGNHDVPLYRVWERFLDPFGAYERHFDEELEPEFHDEELFVLGVNSAHGWTFKDGRIPLSRLLELERRLCEAPPEKAKIVVVHHHVIPPPRFGTQRVLINAWEAMDLFSSVGVDLILSGHLHQAFVGSSEEFYPRGRWPVVILHSGTTTSSRGRGIERQRNSCNWIEIGERTLRISMLRWEPERQRFETRSRHLYPRRGDADCALEGIEV